VLKEAIEQRGEITDDDRRLAAVRERGAHGEVSLAETVCLGFCHASPAVRDGDVVDAGPGVVARALADALQPAVEPVPRSLLIGSSADVNTSCRKYKVVAVDVRPVAEQASRTPAIAAAT
jgi:hypothetical protein